MTDSTSPASEAVELECHDCDFPYGDDAWVEAVVPHDIWNQHLSPYGNEGGILCINCMAKRAVAAGLTHVPVDLTSGPFRLTPPPLQDERPPTVAGELGLCDVCRRPVREHDMGTGFATCRGMAVPIFRSTLNDRIAALSTPVSRPAADLEKAARAMSGHVDLRFTKAWEDGVDGTWRDFKQDQICVIEGTRTVAAALGITFTDE